MNMEEFMEYVEAGKVPPSSPVAEMSRFCFDTNRSPHAFRNKCIELGMWAIVDLEWTARLAKWIGERSALEIMAGAGFLANALYQHGVTITATDDFSWTDRHTRLSPVFAVENMDAISAVRSVMADVLICSWPPYGEETICRACEAWGQDRPIIYIGEHAGGCNAPDEFFSCFVEIEDHPAIAIPQWWGLRDNLQIGHYMKARR